MGLNVQMFDRGLDALCGISQSTEQCFQRNWLARPMRVLPLGACVAVGVVAQFKLASLWV